MESRLVLLARGDQEHRPLLPFPPKASECAGCVCDCFMIKSPSVRSNQTPNTTRTRTPNPHRWISATSSEDSLACNQTTGHARATSPHGAVASAREDAAIRSAAHGRNVRSLLVLRVIDGRVLHREIPLVAPSCVARSIPFPSEHVLLLSPTL